MSGHLQKCEAVGQFLAYSISTWKWDKGVGWRKKESVREGKGKGASRVLIPPKAHSHFLA